MLQLCVEYGWNCLCNWTWRWNCCVEEGDYCGEQFLVYNSVCFRNFFFRKTLESKDFSKDFSKKFSKIFRKLFEKFLDLSKIFRKIFENFRDFSKIFRRFFRKFFEDFSKNLWKFLEVSRRF